MNDSGTHNFAILKAAILAMSHAKTWERAVNEWFLESVQVLDPKKSPPETCTCSHHPIYELCWMRNSITGHRALVGNVCVTRFIFDRAALIGQGLKRIEDDPEAALNEAAAEWAHDRGFLNAWEYQFCISNRLKRRLSGRQWAKRDEINRKVLRRVASTSEAARRLRDQAQWYVGQTTLDGGEQQAAEAVRQGVTDTIAEARQAGEGKP